MACEEVSMIINSEKSLDWAWELKVPYAMHIPNAFNAKLISRTTQELYFLFLLADVGRNAVYSPRSIQSLSTVARSGQPWDVFVP
jgi:hypothetical protein